MLYTGAYRGGQGGHNDPGAESLENAEKSLKCRKCFLQYSTFAPKRSQVRTWGHQTCLFPGRHLTWVHPWWYMLCLAYKIPIYYFYSIVFIKKLSQATLFFWDTVMLSPMKQHAVACTRHVDILAPYFAMSVIGVSSAGFRGTGPGPGPTAKQVWSFVVCASFTQNKQGHMLCAQHLFLVHIEVLFQEVYTRGLIIAACKITTIS